MIFFSSLEAFSTKCIINAFLGYVIPFEGNKVDNITIILKASADFLFWLEVHLIGMPRRRTLLTILNQNYFYSFQLPLNTLTRFSLFSVSGDEDFRRNRFITGTTCSAGPMPR